MRYEEGRESTRMSIAEKFLTMEYGPAPEDPRCAGVARWSSAQFGHFVDGRWREPAEGVFFDSTDPAPGKDRRDRTGSAADVGCAVRAARRCLSQMAGFDSQCTSTLSLCVGARRATALPRLAVLEPSTTQPIRESRDIDIRWSHGTFTTTQVGRNCWTRNFLATRLWRVGQIIPWNFPLLMLAWKIAPALATANTWC